jgi:GT2 family glycosyltransferase
LANSENLFFTKANNQALSRATGRYVLVLNPDTLLEKDTLHKMTGFMDSHPEAGAASCVFLDSSGCAIPTCWRARTLSWLLLSREPIVRIFRSSRVLKNASMVDWDRQSEREVDVVSDAFLFARLSALRDVGFYDESFLLYLTEDDLCMRLRAAGHKILHNPGARICHLVSRSTKKKPMMAVLTIQRDDFVTYFRKHHGAAAGLAAWLICSLELLVWRSYLFVRPEKAGGSGRA